MQTDITVNRAADVLLRRAAENFVLNVVTRATPLAGLSGEEQLSAFKSARSEQTYVHERALHGTLRLPDMAEDEEEEDDDDDYVEAEDEDETYAQDVYDDQNLEADSDSDSDDDDQSLPAPGEPGHEQAVAECLARAPLRLRFEAHLEEICDGFSAAPKAGVVDYVGRRDFSRLAW